jgi:hypothetical protein
MKAALVSVVVALTVASIAAAASPYGTWFGKVKDPDYPEIPASDLSPGKLVVKTSSVTSSFTGLTGATHDPPNATSTCTMQFRFVKEENGWRVYRQKGRMRLSGVVSGGAPFGGICAPSGGALRLRPAGSKLKVEFVGWYQPDDPEAFTGANAGYFHR